MTASNLDVAIVDFHCDVLNECVASLAVLGLGAIDVVHVVDNGGSTDWSVIRKSAERLGASLRVHPFETNVGFGAGVNRALSGVHAPFVLILNPDARVVDGEWASLLAEFDSTPRLGLIGPSVRDPSGELEDSCGHLPRWRDLIRPVLRRGSSWRTPANSNSAVGWVSGVAMFARIGALSDIAGFDRRYFMYYEDIDLCRRLAEHDWLIHTSQSVVVEHDHHGTPMRPWRRTLHQRLGLARLLLMRSSRATEPPRNPSEP